MENSIIKIEDFAWKHLLGNHWLSEFMLPAIYKQNM